MPKIKTSKETLIRKSLEIFKKQGYHNTSLADLAVACGVQKAHFYYYFDSKENLMCEVLQHFQQHLETTVFRIAYQEDLEYAARLETVLQGLETFYLDVHVGCPMVNTIIQTLPENPHFTEIIRTFVQRLIEVIAHLYQDRYSTQYASGKAEQAVQDMYGGLIFSQIFDDNSYFLRALARIKKKI